MKKLAAFFLVLALSRPVQAEERLYHSVLESEIEVTSEVLNVRTGPGSEYLLIGTVKRGDKLPVIGAIGNWYIVQLEDGSVGLVYNDFVKVAKMKEIYIAEGDAAETDLDDTEQGNMFSLANQIRSNNGIKLFAWDEKLNQIAQIKAEDMKRRNYIGHYSENYGTPFEMLKQMGVAYKNASENVAANVSVASGFAAMIATPSQRTNILNGRFNKMGVGIVDSLEYGKIIVQLFIEEQE